MYKNLDVIFTSHSILVSIRAHTHVTLKPLVRPYMELWKKDVYECSPLQTSYYNQDNSDYVNDIYAKNE